MGLSASMWTGVSGLLAHGERMSVLGNNIANVNTVGFKAARMHFEDFISQKVSTTAADFSQIGRGVSVAAVFGDFSQGAYETTNEATDLAIGGEGFFEVRLPGTETTYFTRAGNFRFDRAGFLVDPHGYPLQGLEIPDTLTPAPSGSTTQSITTRTVVGTGTQQDIYVPPEGIAARHTRTVNMVTNLEAGLDEMAVSSNGNPAFAMFERWDARTFTADDPGLDDNEYTYQSTIRVYDESGVSHNLTIYYDPITSSNMGQSGSTRYWEYLVTIDPAEDNRIINGVAMASSAHAGVLMMGTMTFNSSGVLRDMSAYTINGSGPATGGYGAATDFDDLGNWTTTTFRNGYPVFAANFTGHSDASYVVPAYAPGLDPTTEQGQNAPPIELNFGLSNQTTSWATNAGTAADAIGSGAGAFTNIPTIGTANIRYETLATTNFASPSTTQFQSQDGYTSGFLQNVTVNRDGILSGRFSNGVTRELWQITLALFQNEVGLERLGGNLFAQTNESGEAFRGGANTNGRGTISSNSLEQSNVDLAKEFVYMISTQRGFSANGKVITTTDQMLSEVIMLKR